MIIIVYTPKHIICACVVLLHIVLRSRECPPNWKFNDQHGLACVAGAVVRAPDVDGRLPTPRQVKLISLAHPRRHSPTVASLISFKLLTRLVFTFTVGICHARKMTPQPSSTSWMPFVGVCYNQLLSYNFSYATNHRP